MLIKPATPIGKSPRRPQVPIPSSSDILDVSERQVVWLQSRDRQETESECRLRIHGGYSIFFDLRASERPLLVKADVRYAAYLSRPAKRLV